jgi:hypothetical protein
LLFYDVGGSGTVFDAEHLGAIASNRTVFSPLPGQVEGGIQYAEDLPITTPPERKPLGDVFLAVIPVCLVGSAGVDPDLDFLPDELIDKGVDITISTQDCEIHDSLGKIWEELFWQYAAQSDSGPELGIENSVIEASIMAVFINPGHVTITDYLWCTQNLAVKVGLGIDPNAKLFPARYGTAVN